MYKAENNLKYNKMKKTTLTLGFVLVTLVTLFSQTPQAFKYQAVVRDAGGEIIENQAVSLRLSIHEGSVGGTVIYRETHSTATNQYGLISIEIGNGTPDIGSFSTIDWSSATKFLETELDPAGGTSYIGMGTAQLMSVPYALYSENVANNDDADANPANELNSSVTLNGSNLEITDAGSTIITDLSSLVDDADANPANEIQNLSVNGSDLTISDGNTVSLPNSTVTNKISDVDGDTYIDTEQTSDNDSILFITNGVEQVRILPDGTMESDGAITANSFIGDGSALTGILGDNLGDHEATQNIKLNGKWLSNDGGDEGVFVDPGGNVSIGTTTAIGDLNVGNSIFIEDFGNLSAGNLIIDATWGGSFITSNPKIRFGGDTRFSLGIDDSDDDKFKISGSSLLGTDTRFTINSTGYIGIGTSDPSTILDVNGIVTAASFEGDGSGLTGIAGDNLGNHTATQNIVTGNYWISNDGSDDGIFIDDYNGNVGIGTNAPWTKLEINRIADNNVNPTAIFETIGTNSATSIRFKNTNDFYNIGVLPNGSFAISEINHNVNGSDYFIINSSGNVGIGDIYPSTKLEVNGTITATSFIGDGSGLTGITGDNLGNHTATTILNMNNNKITNLTIPTANNDAATKQYVDNNSGDDLGNHLATQNIEMQGNWLSYSGGDAGLFVAGDNHVGIGTDNPFHIFEVHRSFNTNSTPIAVFKENGSNSVAAIRFDNGNTFNIGIAPNGKFSISNQNQNITTLGDPFSITSDGDVIIGGHLSSWKEFNVVGESVFSSDIYLRDEGIVSGDYLVRLWGNSDQGLMDLYDNNTVTTRIYSAGSSYFNGGNLGIGTTSPDELLHVEGGKIKIGTGETLEDGGSFQIAINCVLRPTTDNSRDLGTSSYRWDDVYATNGTIQTSDKRDKQNIKNTTYGLNEILKLNPVSFTWKDKPQSGTKLGLIAQDLQKVIPEVVKSEDWVENEQTGQFENVQLDRLGVYYSDLIPVLIKGMQEQQVIIEDLKSRISQLENK